MEVFSFSNDVKIPSNDRFRIKKLVKKINMKNVFAFFVNIHKKKLIIFTV